MKSIIVGIQGAHHLNDPELAERLGCSAGTIKNARNEAGNLDGVTLMNVEYEFGPSALDPVLALGGSRSVPIDVASDDTVSATIELSEVLHLLIAAQSPASEGGVAVTPTELTRILPQLRDARQALDVLIDRARFAA
ncbi:hypothetical protein O6V14_04725 [Sphingomonas faeni]|uniref:hypothetical protein n=1 Tax=Sphingomonas faeni TaxID=185950 RepID=UPI00335CA5F7